MTPSLGSSSSREDSFTIEEIRGPHHAHTDLSQAVTCSSEGAFIFPPDHLLASSLSWGLSGQEGVCQAQAQLLIRCLTSLYLVLEGQSRCPCFHTCLPALPSHSPAVPPNLLVCLPIHCQNHALLIYDSMLLIECGLSKDFEDHAFCHSWSLKVSLGSKGTWEIGVNYA
jgi:hypothetical protein